MVSWWLPIHSSPITEDIDIMMNMAFKNLFAGGIGLLWLMGSMTGTAGASADGAKNLSVTPKTLNISTFFAGQDLTISGDIGRSEDIIIEIAGKDGASTFDLKGRIGPFWMTTGNVHLENIPELYFMLLPQGQDWPGKAEDLGLGINQLAKRMTTTGTVDVPPDIFAMFTDMKGSEGLYQEIPGAVRYADGRGDLRHFSAVCHIPALITSGTYDITARIMPANGKTRSESARFSVIETGFVKLVDDLSSNRRVLYGVTAVMVALVAGIVMGILFRQSGGGH